MTIAVRFAPSPTGRLHVGNIRAALVNWLFARSQGGTFMLRLDDTDTERSRQDYADGIEADLRWLGLDWDRWARQSDRLDRYEDVAWQLRASGRIYPCWETSEELDLKRRARLGRGLPPVYDRAALALTQTEKAALEASGRAPHWRFRLGEGRLAWTDVVRGEQVFDATDLSDPVVIREDGRPLYTFCSVIDDIDFGITHVIRGEDHVANTAVQLDIIDALGGARPTFAHLALLTDPAGQGLSKRLGSLSIEQLRADGIEPLAIASHLARLGSADPVEPRASMAELVAGFDLTRFSRNPPKFDPNDLMALNHQVLRRLPYADVRARLPMVGVTGADEGFWLAVRDNLTRLTDAQKWWHVINGEVAQAIEDADFLEAALRVLPDDPWDETTWKQWTNTIAQMTGRRGRELYRSLRLALTGLDHGPDLGALLPLIGRKRVVRRLTAASP